MTTIDINSESSITVAEEEVTKYDSSSDEKIFEAKDLLEECTRRADQQISRDVDFLVRVTSRFGRPVRFFPARDLDGQEIGLAPVSPGTCQSKFQFLQLV